MLPLLAEYYINDRQVSASEFWPWAIGIGALAVFLRCIADRMDRSRIHDVLRAAGCVVLDITWTPFGRGWFGEEDSRIYEVRYRTSDGREVIANCKTSMTSGVYWSAGGPPTRYGSDEPASSAPPPEAAQGTSCPRCGRTCQPGASFCSYCGVKL